MTLTHRLALTALFAGAAAFAQTSTATTSTAASGMHSTAAETTAAKMTPSSVLSLIHQVNQDEIKLGKMAQVQAQNDKVKGFAKDMVDDHTALDKKLTDLVQKEGQGKVTLSASQIPAAKLEQMKASGQKAEATLKSASGATFDKEYMSAMLKGHDNVLADLDAQLPALKGNDKIYDFVSDARDKVKAHRDHARDILTDLEKGTATGGSGMQGTSTGTTMPAQSGAANPKTTTPSTTGH
jgi:putative membrane protein